jgi:hypothetical protein
MTARRKSGMARAAWRALRVPYYTYFRVLVGRPLWVLRWLGRVG